MTTQEVLTDASEGILTITINRPEARNAMNRAAASAIASALDQLEARDDLRVGILTGAEGHFCAGMDLKAFLRGEHPYDPHRGFGGITHKPPQKPLIAAVEGYALAGGFELVLACDLVVAADNAQFGLPEVKRGLAATAGGLIKLPRQMPYRIALELALTGDTLPARRAYQLGLINRLTPPGTAVEEARRMARTISANGPLSVRAAKRVVMESQDWASTEFWDRQAAITDHIAHSADAQEGAAAFAEKRPPVWQGR